MQKLWLNWTLERPWLVVAISVLLIVTATIGGKNLYFRGDYKVFFEPENPQRVAFERMQSTFNKNENASIVIAPASGNVFTPATLQLIKELTDQAWQTPLSIRVDSISNFQHTWAEDDDLIVEDLLLDEYELTPERIAKVKEIALAEPNLRDKLISAQGHVAMINITVQLPDGDQTQEVFEITQYVTDLSKQFGEKYPEHQFYHTGMVLMNNAFAASAEQDASTLVPMMFLVVIAVMWILLRSFFATLSTVILIIGIIVATMGLSGWLGMFLSTATVNVPTILMTIAVADCIHVVASMMYGFRQGMDKKAALEYSLKINLMPVIITSVTTAIGFLTLNFAAVPVFADLGNLTAIGVMLACVLSLTLLPALLMILPVRSKVADATKADRMSALGEWVVSHHQKLFWVSLVVIALVASFALRNQINDVATEYFDSSSDFRRSTDFQQDNLSGMTVVDFAIYSERESGINEPAVLAAIGRFGDWLAEQPEVDHVNSIGETFKRLNKNMHGDDQNYYRLPDDQELAAQYILLYEMSLPYGLDLNNQLDIDKSATRIQVTVKNLGSKELVGFEMAAKQWFSERYPELTLSAASPNLMFAHIGETNMVSMLKGTMVALVLISLLLVVALRSWQLGAISLMPNLLPAAVGFGIWGLYSGQINMGLSVVLSMTLGIIVDDTVHFLSKYRFARMQGKDAANAVRYAFDSVARALWITTLVLTLGFSVLTLSSFALNSGMGKLTSIIIVTALAIDFLFLPAFLIRFDKKKYPQEQANA